MKHLTRTLLIIGLIAINSQMQAQVKFGVKAGLNMANISQNFEDSDNEMATKMRFAYHFGGVVSFGFGDIVQLQTGILYSSKGGNIDLEDEFGSDVEVDGYYRYILHFVEIPANFIFGLPAGFQVYAGPYVAVGLGGREKWDYTAKSDTYELSAKGDIKLKPVFGKVGEGDLGDDEDAFYALDFGLNFGIGYEVGPVLIHTGYSLGLGNMFAESEGSDMARKDNRLSNRVFTLSVCFVFGK